MSKTAIDTDHNFVKNPDMQEGYASWEDVFNPRGVVIRDDSWNGVVVSIMTLTDAAAVRQRMVVPVAQQADARYALRFLYENTYPSSGGQVVVNKKGGSEKLVIELPPKSGVRNVDPLTVDLTELQENLPDRLDLQPGEELELNLISPKKIAGDGNSAEIRLTGFFIKLDLTALVLGAVVNDGRRFASGSVLPLCLGATGVKSHTLDFEVDAASVWRGLEASLSIKDNPLDAITAKPELGQTQPIDRSWQVDCPDLPGDEPRELEAMISSKYSAPPYPLRISWGHHRLELIARKAAQTHPVIEYAQSVELEVQVRSFYTQAPVQGEVIWRTGDGKNTILHQAATDAQGRASFSYTPTDEGVSLVTASVPSLLSENGEATQTFEVRAFAIDPFKTLQARFDGGPPAVWGEKPRYPERGEKFPVNLDIPAGHPLLAAEFFLYWPDGDLPADVGGTSQPEFESPASVVGGTVLWDTSFEDIRDGIFGWVLGCSRLQHLSRSNVMSLAYNKVEIGETWGPNKSPVVDESDFVTCMVKVQTRDRRPVSNAEVKFQTPDGIVFASTGVEGWASVDHLPADARDYEIIARVQRREDAPVEEHSFPVKALPSSDWNKQVTVTVDAKPVDRVTEGVVCRRGTAHKLRIAPTVGSSFIGKPIALDLNENTSPLPGLQLNPPFGVAREMVSTGLEWDITSGTDRSGFSTLAFSSSHLSEKYELPLRLLGSDLSTEVRVMIDHVSAEPDAPLFPCLWATHRLALMPLGISALHGLPVKLTITPLAPGMVVDPPLTEDIVMTAGGARRQLDFTNSDVAVEMTQTVTIVVNGESLTAQTQLKLGHNKVKPVDALGPAIDPVLDKGQRARVQAQFYSAFADRPVASAAIAWKVGSAEPIGSPTGEDGWSVHDAQPQSEGSTEVSATAINRYDGSTVVRNFEMTVHPTDPWDGLRLITGSSDQPWARGALFPRRGEPFSFHVQADENSPLCRQALAVGLSHPGASELELEFIEPLGEFREMPADGLTFSFNAGDVKDHSVSVRLASSRLLELSSPQPMSLGSKAIAANITASSSVLQVVNWGAPVVLEVWLKSATYGKPMPNVQIRWERGEHEPMVTTTDFRGSAQISFIPGFPGPGAVRASVVGGADAAWVTFHYSMNEPRGIATMSADLPGGSPGQWVTAQVDVISARTGKPLMDVKVHWVFRGLQFDPTYTDVQGTSKLRFRLPAFKSEVLRASVEGGIVGRVVRQIEFTGIPIV